MQDEDEGGSSSNQASGEEDYGEIGMYNKEKNRRK